MLFPWSLGEFKQVCVDGVELTMRVRGLMIVVCGFLVELVKVNEGGQRQISTFNQRCPTPGDNELSLGFRKNETEKTTNQSVCCGLLRVTCRCTHLTFFISQDKKIVIAQFIHNMS